MMPLTDLKITVNNEKYNIRRTILCESSARYRLQVFDTDDNEQFDIQVTCSHSGSFIESDNYIKKVVENLIKARDEEQVS